MSRWFTLAFILLAAGAVGLRAPQLDRRPMHTDESVQAWKFRDLWEKGVYRYDPTEYHGPSLSYATLPSAWLSSARNFAQITEGTLRRVPVAFGILTLLLLWLVRDASGRGGVLCAGLLTALSPAFVFYSRYYIHETLLVCFTFVVLAAGWRYSRRPCLGWALAAGLGLGLMCATKETFVIPLAAIVLALVASLAWSQWVDDSPNSLKPFLKLGHWLPALALGALVAFVLFSSLFTNWSGPLDSIQTYLPWFHRAAGKTKHVHPWHYYLGLLAFTHRGRGPVFSEALILVLAIVGMATALVRLQSKAGQPLLPPSSTAPSGENTLASGQSAAESTSGLLVLPDLSWLRFLTFYSLLMIIAYSAIPYKTPWCLLGFLHGLVLLAGVGAVVLLGVFRQPIIRGITAAILLAASVNLGWQAWQTSYALCADQRNPYVYAHTSEDILNLAQKVAAVAKVYPPGRPLIVKVMADGNDFWPLPWYLRQFDHVGWYPQVPDDPQAPIVIASPSMEKLLEQRLGATHLMVGIFGLRPAVFLELFVEKDLWAQYLKTRKPGDEE